MRKITLSEYNAIPEDYRGIWTVERWDLPDWADLREKHIGKRTMMAYDNGTCLLVEGMGFEIVDDSSWKKPDEVRQEIGCHYLKFYSGQGRDPHYADCVTDGVTRWKRKRQGLLWPWIPIRRRMTKYSFTATVWTI